MSVYPDCETTLGLYFFLIFQSLEVVSRYSDTQLQVIKNLQHYVHISVSRLRTYYVC